MNFIALTLPRLLAAAEYNTKRAICHNCELLIFFSWAIIKAEKSSSSPGAHRERAHSIQRGGGSSSYPEQRGRGESILAMDGMQKLCSWRRINFMITSLEARWTPSVPFETEAVAATNALKSKSEAQSVVRLPNWELMQLARLPCKSRCIHLNKNASPWMLSI